MKAELHIPDDHPCFEAHFPRNPIVPGALLLQWIVDQASEIFSVQIKGVKQMKFMTLVRPGDNICVEYDMPEEKLLIKVTCVRGLETVCRGNLLLGASGEDG